MNIVHIITSLEEGGAEKCLYNLLLIEKKHSHYVIALKRGGFFYSKLKRANIKVFEFNFDNLFVFLINILPFINLLKKIKPDIVQTWMYHSNLLGGIIAKLLGVKRIIWNIRGCYEKNHMSFKTKIVIKLNSLFSSIIPNIIISNSNYARQSLIKIGFNNNIKVIHNGFKVNKFDKSKLKIKNFYKKNKILSKTILFSMVARYDILKDHKTLFKSLSLLKEKNITDFKCFLVGKNIDNNNHKIMNLINLFKLNDQMILLGNIEDIDFIYHIVDINILSSHSESFPNVIAESMLNKTPCIASNVGDIKNIIGKNGWIVEKENSKKLYLAILKSLKLMSNKNKWHDLQKNCYLYILNNFKFKKMISNYLSIWEKK